ncbi:MAG TPA: PIN domain-containing protein [Luteolibacter sp.]|nr:PIN domain-containing protein [Luteolibacter sp.]
MIRLLDTDTFILLLRGTALVRPRTAREKSVAASARRIRDRCRKETADGWRVGLSAITLAELEYGLHACGRYEEKRPALQRVLLPFEHFAFEPVDCVHHYGRIRAALEKSGKTIGPLDMLIAAHALALDATLITHNTREFRRVPDLGVEDWA